MGVEPPLHETVTIGKSYNISAGGPGVWGWNPHYTRLRRLDNLMFYPPEARGCGGGTPTTRHHDDLIKKKNMYHPLNFSKKGLGL